MQHNCFHLDPTVCRGGCIVVDQAVSSLYEIQLQAVCWDGIRLRQSWVYAKESFKSQDERGKVDNQIRLRDKVKSLDTIWVWGTQVQWKSPRTQKGKNSGSVCHGWLWTQLNVGYAESNECWLKHNLSTPHSSLEDALMIGWYRT